jgi:hypothetical protein
MTSLEDGETWSWCYVDELERQAAQFLRKRMDTPCG